MKYKIVIDQTYTEIYYSNLYQDTDRDGFISKYPIVHTTYHPIKNFLYFNLRDMLRRIYEDHHEI